MDLEETTDKKQKVSLDELLEYIGFGRFTIKLISIVGVLYIIDGSQLTEMAVMTPQLRCKFNLPKTGASYIHTCGLVGMAFGAVYWGWLADKCGRRFIAIPCSTMVLYFALLTIFSDNLVMFMLLRGLLGFGVGGIVCAPCYISEVTTSKYRGKVILASQMFFGLGSVYTTVIALLTVNHNLGYQYFVIFTCIPLPFFILAFLWLPESILYLRNTGDYDTLLRTLLSLSIMNKKPFAIADVKIDCRPSEKRGQLSRLFKRKHLLKLIIVCILSFAGYFCYYGAILQHTYFLRLHKRTGLDLTVMDATTHQKKELIDPGVACHVLSNHEYLQFLYASLGELISILLIFPIIDLVGRKRMIVALLLINVICYFAIMYVNATTTSFTMPMSVVIAILRGSSVALIVINFLLTTEIFPTLVRGTALGLCAFCSRMSIILVTYMVHVLYPISIVSVLMLFVGLCVLCSLLTTLLPETTGQLLANK